MNDSLHSFFSQQSNIGHLMQKYDWKNTVLGPIDSWPSELHSTLQLLTHSNTPMILFWGDQNFMFPNDSAMKFLKAEQSIAEFDYSIKFLANQPELVTILTDGVQEVYKNHKNVFRPMLNWLTSNKVEVIESEAAFDFNPIFTRNGHIGGVLLVINSQSSTTNKLTTNLLEESWHQKAILQSPNPIILFKGPEFYVTLVNKKFAELWDVNTTEVLSKSLLELLPKKQQKEIIPILKQVYRSGIAHTVTERQVKIKRKYQSETRYFNIAIEPIRDQNNEIIGIIGVGNDITLQIELRNAVEDVEKKFRNTLRQVPLGISIVKGQDLTVEFVNPAFLEIIGRSESECLGKQAFDILPEIEEIVSPLFRQVTEQGVPYYSDSLGVTLHRYGREESCFFNTVFQPLRNENENVTGILVVTYEVTTAVQSKHLLLESERAFRNLVMESPIPMAIFRGKNHSVEIANTAMLSAMWRREASTTIGRPFFEIFPELLTQSFPDLLKEVLDKQIIIKEDEALALIEVNHRLEKFYLDFQYTPLLEKEGKTSGIMVTANDVTKQVESRKIVEDAEERIRLAAEIAGIATWDFNLQTRSMIHSPKLLCILGLEEGTIITYEKIKKSFHPEDVHILIESFKTALRTNLYEFEARIIKEDNSIHWIKAHGKLYKDELNLPVKMIGIMIDVTDEKNRNQILMKSEEKFRLLADSMPQHVWTSDEHGNLNYFNKSVYNYSGLSEETIMKEGQLQIVHPDEKQANEILWNQAIQTGNDFIMEHRFRRHDGVYRWQLSRARPQKDSNGNIQMWVGTSTDIQDQKDFSSKLEQEVHERTAELESKNKDLIQMNLELQSFAYVSSHDLQEPLRKIQTFVSRMFDLNQDDISEKAKMYLEKIDLSAKRMQTLIQDLLEYSRTNSNDRIFSTANLDDIAREVKMDFSEKIEDLKADIKIDSLGTAMVIPFQFRQLLHNLIGNALKFARKDIPPVIKIQKEVVAGSQLQLKLINPNLFYIHISVSDNGIGFDPEFKERIFNVFQRLNTAKEFSGTGIGLAIVKKIVENHKGVILASSDINQGATFHIYLPIY